MFIRLLLLFTIVPVIELYLLVTLGAQIGVWTTLGIAIFTGVLGAALAKHEGLRTLQDAQIAMQAGQMPTNEMIDGLLIFLAGAVLVTPGFLTDTAGFLLLLPPVRAMIRMSLKKRLATHFTVVMQPDIAPGASPFAQSSPKARPQQSASTDAGKPGAAKPDVVVPPKNGE